MIKSVIFDFFGVLTEEGWSAFMTEYGNKKIIDQLRDISRQADSGMISYDEFLTQVCQLTGADRAETHRIITSTHHPNKAVFAFVRQLKTSGYGVSIISNVGSPLTNFLPAEYIDLFDDITLSYTIGIIKPAPAIYEAHLNTIGVPAEQTIFIDDREVNCEGARAVGMQAIFYEQPEKLKTDLQAAGVKIA